MFVKGKKVLDGMIIGQPGCLKGLVHKKSSL